MTLADAITAHDYALEFGGRPGISSLHLIQSALGRAYSGYYPRLWSKAAAMLHSCVANHGFVDANKRTAWILTELLIERSGYELNIPDDEPIDDLVVAIAAGQVQFDEIEDWFRTRLRKASAQL